MTTFASRSHLPCRNLQRFTSAQNAAAFAAHADRRKVSVPCEHCAGYHVRVATEAERAKNDRRAEAERLARVRAHLTTVPERER